MGQEERTPAEVSLNIRRSDGESQETENVTGRGYFREADGIWFLVYETGEGLRQQIEFWPEKAVVWTAVGDDIPENQIPCETPKGDTGCPEGIPCETPKGDTGCPEGMIFRTGERLSTEYHTLYGALAMETYTREYRMDGKAGEWLRAELLYELYMGGAFASECRMEILAVRRTDKNRL